MARCGLAGGQPGIRLRRRGLFPVRKLPELARNLGCHVNKHTILHGSHQLTVGRIHLCCRWLHTHVLILQTTMGSQKLCVLAAVGHQPVALGRHNGLWRADQMGNQGNGVAGLQVFQANRNQRTVGVIGLVEVVHRMRQPG